LLLFSFLVDLTRFPRNYLPSSPLPFLVCLFSFFFGMASLFFLTLCFLFTTPSATFLCSGRPCDHRFRSLFCVWLIFVLTKVWRSLTARPADLLYGSYSGVFFFSTWLALATVFCSHLRTVRPLASYTNGFSHFPDFHLPDTTAPLGFFFFPAACPPQPFFFLAKSSRSLVLFFFFLSKFPFGAYHRVAAVLLRSTGFEPKLISLEPPLSSRWG